MNFSRFDIGLIFAMSLALILMSFIMPAAGITGGSDNASESDVPEFNISSSEWDIAGDFPANPGTPTSGTIERFENKTIIDEHIAWVDRPKSDGASIELTNFSGDMNINFNNWSGGSSVANDLINITAEGDTYRLANESYAWEFTVDHFANHGEPNMSAIVDWELTSTPNAGGGGLLDAIPIIGGLFNAGEQLVAMLGYLASIIYWFAGMTVEVALSLVSILLSILVFGVDMLVFMTNTYSDMISEADGWAAVIVTIPAIILSLEFAKIGMIGVKLLPFT